MAIEPKIIVIIYTTKNGNQLTSPKRHFAMAMQREHATLRFHYTGEKSKHHAK